MKSRRFALVAKFCFAVSVALAAYAAYADIRTSKLAADPTYFKIWDIDGAAYVTVGTLTPANLPTIAIGHASGSDLSLVDAQWSVTGPGVASFASLNVGGVAVTAATRFTVYGAGTAYSLTNTQAAIDLGTTDPVITLTTAGTYHITGRVKLTYTGATVVAETATVKLRRTNNTAGDVSDTSQTIDLPVSTALTHDWGWVPFDVYYTTTNVDDAITIFGAVSATLGAGTINVNACNLIAERVQ